MTTIFVLLVLFQIKHFVCDYLLQGEYMLGKFKTGTAWILPLIAHSSVHAFGTFLIVYNAAYWSRDAAMAIWLAFFDFVVHFLMDRIKASPNLMGRWKPLTAAGYTGCKHVLNTAAFDDDSLFVQNAKDRLRGNVLFWRCLGFDQMVHHLTHYVIIYCIVS